MRSAWVLRTNPTPSPERCPHTLGWDLGTHPSSNGRCGRVKSDHTAECVRGGLYPASTRAWRTVGSSHTPFSSRRKAELVYPSGSPNTTRMCAAQPGGLLENSDKRSVTTSWEASRLGGQASALRIVAAPANSPRGPCNMGKNPWSRMILVVSSSAVVSQCTSYSNTEPAAVQPTRALVPRNLKCKWHSTGASTATPTGCRSWSNLAPSPAEPTTTSPVSLRSAYRTTRWLKVSATTMPPAESVATPQGNFNWSPPLPSPPNPATTCPTTPPAL
mmetsp:Transcript_78957/g.180612  ORF Transcript_78957/g.180612 Transcript_78957/m.180612 type:complete len:274 (-) Transcript_78957:636-1457(-)